MANENNRPNWLKQSGGRTHCSMSTHKAPALWWAGDAMWQAYITRPGSYFLFLVFLSYFSYFVWDESVFRNYGLH